MHPLGFKPFVDTLKSPWNLMLVLIGVTLVVDLMLGSPLMSRVVQLQMRVMNIDPSVQQIRLVTIFGTFTDVGVWTRFIERILAIVFLALPSLSWLRGLFVSFVGK